MDWTGYSPLDATLVLAAAWLLLGFLGVLAPRNTAFVARIVFPLGALVGLALLVTAAAGITSPIQTHILVVGLPDLPIHVRLDALSCVFLA
ncbi:MAG: hydrogenase 4 subunit B, partial [Steroidobacteraceae bacterium]